MRNKTRLLKFYPQTLIVCAIIVLSISAGHSFSAEQRPVLENDFVRFEFDAQYMGLAAMIDKKTGLNHIQPLKEKHKLWELVLAHGITQKNLSNTDVPCTGAKFDTLADGTKRAVFEWRKMAWWREEGVINVQVTIDLPKDNGIACWRISVDNDSDMWGLWEVEFPKFSGYLKPEEYDIAIPGYNWGTLYKHCSRKVSRNYRGGEMPMQFLCAVKGSQAVYMATHDKRAWRKKFTINPGDQFYVTTDAENMAVPGSDHKDPFPVMIGVYQGDWMKGCKIYRQFAITAPWTCEGKLSQRSSVPQAVKDLGLWMKIEVYPGPETAYTADKGNDPFIDAQKFFDVPLAAHLYRWHEIPFDKYYPHYLPTKPGVAQRARKLVSQGLIIMPYINGRIVDTLNADFDDYLPYAAKDQTAVPYLEVYGQRSGRMTPMCPYTEFWQNRVAEIVDTLADELGINAIYIDQAACSMARLCFDESHGHPLGGGCWWADGYRKMFEKIQAVAHSKGRDMTITSEMAVEYLIDGVDAFLTCSGYDGRSIPMLAAVYGDYAIYMGSPASFRCTDRGWIMIQGRDFIWGCQNGWMGFDVFKPEHSNKAAYLKKIGKYRVAAKKFLTYGELVDTIEHTETVTEPWYTRQAPATGPYRGRESRQTLPIIQGSIFKAEDDSLGIFLVNYLKKESTIDFCVEPSQYGIKSPSGKYVISRISPECNKIEGTVPAGIIKRMEMLGPWEIRVLEIKPKK
ncbi:MAG: hypothetical protein JXB29_06530 [Sedimentisphaerales bacterium]|nr:hypothetical protein [Sedimentisphaerales bacterium]